MFTSHLTQAETNWQEFADVLPEASWIHLYRHDVAARYVSLVRAKTSRTWIDHGDTEASGVLPVEIDLGGLAAHFEENVTADREAHEAHEALSGRRGYRLISYEDFQAERLEDGITNPEGLATAEQQGIRWHPAKEW